MSWACRGGSCMTEAGAADAAGVVRAVKAASRMRAKASVEAAASVRIRGGRAFVARVLDGRIGDMAVPGFFVGGLLRVMENTFF